MRVVDRKSCRECKNRLEFGKPDDNQVNRTGVKFAFGTKRSRVRISPLRLRSVLERQGYSVRAGRGGGQATRLGAMRRPVSPVDCDQGRIRTAGLSPPMPAKRVAEGCPEGGEG